MVDVVRIMDERVGSEDRKHILGGEFVVIDSNLGAVVGEKDGAVESISSNEGRTTQVWVNVRGGMRMFAAYFWHMEGWAPRHEAILGGGAEESQGHKTSMAGSM